MREDILLKTDKDRTKDITKEIETNEGDNNINVNYMRRICNSLLIDDYQPQNTLDIIKEYLDCSKNSMRLMYSELSNQLFSIFEDEKSESDYNFNISKLYEYVMKNEVTSDSSKIVIKIFDHSLLVSYQIDGIKERANKIAKKMLEDESEKNKKILMKSMRESEKQYITILGIFASIVLAFTGGVAFSTSVLSNIDRASIYRLVFIISLLGFILFNTICVMFEFVREINDKEMGLSLKNIFKKPLWLIPNVVLASIMIISTLAYYLGKM